MHTHNGRQASISSGAFCQSMCDSSRTTLTTWGTKISLKSMHYISIYFLETKANFTARMAMKKVDSTCLSTNTRGVYRTLLAWETAIAHPCMRSLIRSLLQMSHVSIERQPCHQANHRISAVNCRTLSKSAFGLSVSL